MVDLAESYARKEDIPGCTYSKLLDDPKSTTAQGMREVAVKKGDKIAIRCLLCEGTRAYSVFNGCDRFHAFDSGFRITSRPHHPGIFDYRNIEEEKEYRRVAEITENEIDKLRKTQAETRIMRNAIWGTNISKEIEEKRSAA